MDTDPILKDLIKDYSEMSNQGLAPCMTNMKPVFKKYIHKELLTVSYPVLDSYLNPRKTMQGGFITAAFDNTFGALSYYSAGKKFMATIDINNRYHYPIFEGDELTVTVRMVSLGKTIVSMRGEAVNSEGRLIATAGTDVMIMDSTF
ncbi:MAG TPA: PaaI family thioesterase [Clostridia bacterium]|nr:PaaI family thioesterase [Clostridia bacterium]